MPEKMQQSLLRVLEDKMVTPISGKPVMTDFRLITASSKDLRKLALEGKVPRRSILSLICMYGPHSAS